MFKIAVEMESLSSKSIDRLLVYKNSYIDLAEIATVIENMGSGPIQWKVLLKSGKELVVQPYKNQDLTFDGFIRTIRYAKMSDKQREIEDGEDDC